METYESQRLSRDIAKEQIRNCYITKRRSSGSSNYKPNEAKLTDALLGKAADMCRFLNATPQMYVDAMASRCTFDTFYPNQLVTSNSERYYREYVASLLMEESSTPKTDIEIQLKYLSKSLTLPGRTVEDILLDDRIDFAPWFRVTITKAPIPSVLEKYLPAAKKQVTHEIIAALKSFNIDTSRLY